MKAALAIFVALLVGCASVHDRQWKIAAASDDAIDARVESFQQRFGIDLLPAGEGFRDRPLVRTGELYSADPVDTQLALRAIDRIAKQLELYPAAVLRKAGVKRIYLVAHLRSGTTNLCSFVTDAGMIFIDTLRPGDQLDRAVHHELFHLLDGRSFGADPRVDRAWRDLNAPSATYTDELGLLNDRQWQRLDPGIRQGFISSYARFAPMEDKAELFEWMAYRPAVLDGRQDRDPILLAKRRVLMERLQTIDPVFASDFWRDARAAEAKRIRR